MSDVSFTHPRNDRFVWYDAFMRLPIVFLTLYFLWREFLGLAELVGAHPYWSFDGEFLGGLFSRLGIVVFLILLVAFHLGRHRPVAKFSDWKPKFSALLGMGLGYALFLLPRAQPDAAWDLAASFFLFVGNFMCVLSVSTLGRSLSIMPEARKLVTVGIYSKVRHPLYLSELVADIGIFMQFRSWWALLILIGVLYFQIQRMRWEEEILSRTFDEYEAYRARTWRLLPGVY
jgi:protein-S-isoprenylcysteine O-methyltransferase Ste14